MPVMHNNYAKIAFNLHFHAQRLIVTIFMPVLFSAALCAQEPVKAGALPSALPDTLAVMPPDTLAAIPPGTLATVVPDTLSATLRDTTGLAGEAADKVPYIDVNSDFAYDFASQQDTAGQKPPLDRKSVV